MRPRSKARRRRRAICLAGLALSGYVCAQQQQTPPPAAAEALRVCADPDNLPQSNDRGEGYENKIAEALARDLKRRLEYTWFPQRMGFVRNTLRARDETTQQFKCDVIMGVPSGYELTVTTRPYMHSTYALVFVARGDLAALHSVQDLLQLPVSRRQALRIGLFARTPAADWALQNGFMEHAVLYAPQSGDPHVTAESIVEGDLRAGNIDGAVLWGPIAGYLVSRHDTAKESGSAWTALSFPADPHIRFDYQIAMGVRTGEQGWKDTLDAWIAAHQDEIDAILRAYHVPLL